MKRLCALLLALLLLGSLAPVCAAEEGERVEIASVEDFLRFSAACAEESYSAGRVFELTADLDLSNTDYRPAPYFAGRFLGNGHLIMGLRVTGEGSRLGLFRRTAEAAEIRELTVRGRVTPGGSAVNIGGLVGENAGSVVSCSFEGDVSGIENVGGVVGRNTASGRVEECSFSGTLTAEHQAGGIAGSNAGVLHACVSSGEINTVSVTPRGETRFDLSAIREDDFLNLTNIGGIAGENDGVIATCFNRGPVGYKHEGFNVGGVAGKSAGYVCDCENSAAVTGRRDVGGVVGQLIPYAAWDFSEGRLEELAGRLSAMQNLLADLRRDVYSFSGDIAAELLLLNDYTHQALDAVGDLMWKTVDNELTLEASLTFGGGERPEFDFSVGELWSLDTTELNEALANMRGEAQYIASLAGQELAIAADDLNDIAKQMDAIFSGLQSGLSGLGGSLSRTFDLSESRAWEWNTGAVQACRNTGGVDAENNAGGVVGSVAFELDFDMEDRLNVSDFLISDAKRYLFAAVRGCRSFGAVSVKEDCAGGVAGTVDVGLLTDCVAAGEARSQSGDYVGGVVGSSKGSVVNCWARTLLSGRRYVGGVAGLAADLRDCRSWAYIDAAREYQGAVAGWAEGTVAGNLYVPGAPDGVDGVSLTGQCARVSAEELLALEGAPADLERVTVRFVLPDGGSERVEVPFGGSLESLPAVPNRDAAFWRWDAFDAEHIYHSLTVGGRYYAPDSTLSTGEDVPRFLVEGLFYEGQKLTAVACAVPLPEEEVLSAATLYVSGYEGALTVRMQAPEKGALYRLGAEGELERLSAERDGSYLVFPLENGGSVVYVREQETPRDPRLIPAAAASALALLVTVCVLGKKKKRRSAASAKEADGSAP